MQTMRCCFAALLLLCVSVEKVQASVPLDAGFAEADISPQLDATRPIWLAGKEYNRPAQGIHDKLYARAVVLRAGGKKIALVAIDSIGLQYPAVQRARAELAGFDYVLVASTHSHETPDVVGVWGPSPTASGVVPAYVNLVEQGIVAAAREADKSAAPVRVEYATMDDPSLLKDFRLPEVFDGVLRVLKFVRVADGSTHGLVVQWNSHPVEPSKNFQVSRDFMGVTVDTLAARHNCRVVYFQGAIGGLMGTPTKVFQGAKSTETFELIRAAGETIADLTDRALKTSHAIELTPLDVFAKPIAIPLDNEGFRQARAGGVIPRPAYVWTGQRDQRGEPLPAGKVDGPQAFETEVAYLRLGQLHVAGIPGELYPELVYGKFQDPADPGADFPDAPLETPVAKILPSEKLLLIGLANDEVGYIVPKRQWDVAAPFCYDRKSAQYGERNSVGPETARMLMEALAERVAEAAK